MYVRARVRRVILEDGDGVRAELAAVTDERGEERGHVREEHLVRKISSQVSSFVGE